MPLPSTEETGTIAAHSPSFSMDSRCFMTRSRGTASHLVATAMIGRLTERSSRAMNWSPGPMR